MSVIVVVVLYIYTHSHNIAFMYIIFSFGKGQGRFVSLAGLERVLHDFHVTIYEKYEVAIWGSNSSIPRTN